MAAFIRFAAFIYINALMFGHLFKIKDFEFLIPSLATIYLLIGMIPESPIDVSLVFKVKIQLYSWSNVYCYIHYFMVGCTVQRRI